MSRAERLSICLLFVALAAGFSLTTYFFWRIGGAVLAACFVVLVAASLASGWRQRRR